MIVGWHHWLNGQEFEQMLGHSEGPGNLACCCSLGSQRVEHDFMTEQQQLFFFYCHPAYLILFYF